MRTRRIVLVLSLAACGPSSGPATGVDTSETAAVPPEPEPAPIADGETKAAPVAQVAPAPEPEPKSEPEPEAAPDPLAPLPAELAAAFEQIRFDPRPDSITRDSHYWVSNEHSHFLWHDRIEDLGGALMGVGTDQNYLLAGWARSEVIVLMDFDRAISNLHMTYRLIFDKAETPEQFVDLWLEERMPEVFAMIDEQYVDHPRYRRIKLAYKISRKLVSARLRNVRRQYTKLGMPTFLTDQAQYDHLRKLWKNGRVVAVRGDLTADQTMVDIAAALKKADIPLNVLYLSNAEQYFENVPSYRRNIIGLPFGDNGVVLRTLGWGMHGFVEGEEYHYNMQSGANFQDWMKTSRVKAVGYMLKKKTDTDYPGSSTLEAPPVVYNKPPEIAK